MSKTTAPLSPIDVPMMWEINEQGLPGTGQVTQQEMAALLELSELSLGAYQDNKLAGFVLCLAQPDQTTDVTNKRVVHAAILAGLAFGDTLGQHFSRAARSAAV